MSCKLVYETGQNKCSFHYQVFCGYVTMTTVTRGRWRDFTQVALHFILLISQCCNAGILWRSVLYLFKFFSQLDKRNGDAVQLVCNYKKSKRNGSKWVKVSDLLTKIKLIYVYSVVMEVHLVFWEKRELFNRLGFRNSPVGFVIQSS